MLKQAVTHQCQFTASIDGVLEVAAAVSMPCCRTRRRPGGGGGAFCCSICHHSSESSIMESDGEGMHVRAAAASSERRMDFLATAGH